MKELRKWQKEDERWVIQGQTKCDLCDEVVESTVLMKNGHGGTSKACCECWEDLQLTFNK